MQAPSLEVVVKVDLAYNLHWTWNSVDLLCRATLRLPPFSGHWQPSVLWLAPLQQQAFLEQQPQQVSEWISVRDLQC
jgi:hypothetical protein